MKTNILYTSINTETQEGQMKLHKLMNARESHRVQELVGQTITMNDFVIFEREDRNGADNTVMMFYYNDEMYGTISGSFIDPFESFLAPGFSPEYAKTVKIGMARSKKGRDFLTAEII